MYTGPVELFVILNQSTFTTQILNISIAFIYFHFFLNKKEKTKPNAQKKT